MKIFNKIITQTDSCKIIRVKLLGVTIYKKKKFADKSKIKLLGLYLIKTKHRNMGADAQKKKSYVLGLPVMKVITMAQIKKYTFLLFLVLR